MNCATWNVRGLNKGSHISDVCNFISCNNLSFVSLLENKVKLDIFSRVTTKINRNWQWVFNYDYHDNGRIWDGWGASIWDISFCNAFAQHLSCLAYFK